MCRILQNGIGVSFCCLNSFAHTYWMEMLKTQPGRYFKELSKDVLFAEYSRGEGSLLSVQSVCFPQPGCSFVRCKCYQPMASSSGVWAPIWMILVLKYREFNKLDGVMQFVFYRGQTEI